MRRRRGLSLLEVLVATVVGALLLTAVLRVFVVGLHVFKYSSAQSDVQAAGLIGMSTLTREFRESNSTTLSVVTQDQGYSQLAFRVQDSSPTALTGFTPAQQFIVYYLSTIVGPTEMPYLCLCRLTIPPNDPYGPSIWGNEQGGDNLGNPFNSNRPLTVHEVLDCASYGGNSAETLRSVAPYMKSMTVTPANYPTNAAFNGITITLVAQEFLNSTESVQQTYSETVTMSNSACWVLPTPTPKPTPTP